MVSSSLLHQLIHSLSKTEKKYFKDTSGGQNYLKLFDAINAQKEYNEEEIKRKFKSEPFVRNFSVAKNYLLEALLRALRNFNAGKLMDDVSYERLQNLKLLFQKGLIQSADKQIPKLKKFCYDYEQLPRLLELLTFEMQLNNTLIRSNNKIYDERLRILKVITNINELNRIHDEMMMIATNKGPFEKIDRARMDALVKSPVVKEENLVGLRDELYALWNVRFVYHYVCKNYRESYLAKKKQWQLYQDSSVFISTRPKTYLLMLGNLVSLAYNIPDIKEFDLAYAALLNAHNKVQGFEGLKFEQLSSFGLLKLKLKKNYSGVEKLVNFIEASLEEHRANMTIVREFDIYFNVALALFRGKKYSKALDWLHKIFNHTRAEERQQVQHFARNLELLVHYELGNLELLDYKLTNTQRYLAKRKLLGAFDELLLHSFRSIIKAADKHQLQKVFKQFAAAITKHPKEELKKIVAEQFEYPAWVEEKLAAFSRPRN